MRGRQSGARQRSGRNPVLLLWMFIAAAAMVLAGCGNLSLNSALSNESPGEFRLSPETVNVQVGGTFTFSATGGFTPYNYQIVSGLGDVVKDQTWVYEAPKTTISDPPYYIDVLIQATDQLGDLDTATVRVFNPFSIVGQSVRIVQIPNTITIEVDGGVPSYSSTAVHGTVEPSGTNSFIYTPTTSCIDVMSITDLIGNYVEVTVIVLPEFNPPLTIYPDSAAVKVGETVTFEAYGGASPYSWTPVANINPTIGTPVTYTATAVGKDTVTLTDSADPPSSVTATVTITADAIDPLVLSPDAPTVTAIGDQVQFSATGGVPPYTFSSAPPGYIDGNGLYTQIGSHKKVNVLVKDSAGANDVTTVYYAP